MHINRLTVKYFRSVKDASINCDKFNILVGQNNHGKTNVFEAVEWFFNGPKKGENIDEIRFGRKGSNAVEVEIEFIGAQDGMKNMKNETNKKKIEEVLKGSNTIVIKRSSDDPKKRTMYIDGKWTDKLVTGFDKALNDFLPKLEYVDTRKFYQDVAKYGKTTPIGIMLSGVLTTILEKSEQYQKFHDKFHELFEDDKSEVKIELDKLSDRVKIYLEKQFPDCTRVKFEVNPPIFEDLLKSFDTTVDDGVETTASEKGDGMQRALMLSILQAYADFRRENEEIGKSFIFFIDEAELHLHPTAQRNLKEVLLDISKGEDQVFINTHSSVLVADEHEHQSIFMTEKINKETTISLINESEKPYIVYDLLGGSPTDLLLPPNFMIVEGRSEFTLLMKVVNRFYSDKKNIQVIYAEGDHAKQERSMAGVNSVFIPLHSNPIYSDKLVILCDTPHPSKQSDFDAFKSSYPTLETSDRLFVIPQNSLEEYYPEPWKKTADQVSALSAVIGGKTRLAKEVGDNITQAQFESEMSVVFDALKKCWDMSY